MAAVSRVELFAHTPVRETLYRRLQEQIISGRFAPGEVLHDKQIAGAFGVSRMPVREALRRLEDEGFVQAASNRWTRVMPLDLKTTLERYAIVEALEMRALALVWPSLTRRQDRRLQESNVAMLHAARRDDAAAALAADDAFHAAWVDECENAELSSLIHRIKLQLRRVELAYFSAFGRMTQSYREHREVMRAIRTFSLTQGTKALRRNWRGAAALLAAGAAGARPRSPRG